MDNNYWLEKIQKTLHHIDEMTDEEFIEAFMCKDGEKVTDPDDDLLLSPLVIDARIPTLPEKFERAMNFLDTASDEELIKSFQDCGLYDKD
mgnify:FL=1